MIRFSPAANIDMFTYDFTPILLNVSTWSNRTGHPVLVVNIIQPKGTTIAPPLHSLSMCFFPVASDAEPAGHMREFLKKAMPGDFEVLQSECYVYVNKLLKQPRTAAKEG